MRLNFRLCNRVLNKSWWKGAAPDSLMSSRRCVIFIGIYVFVYGREAVNHFNGTLRGRGFRKWKPPSLKSDKCH